MPSLAVLPPPSEFAFPQDSSVEPALQLSSTRRKSLTFSESNLEKSLEDFNSSDSAKEMDTAVDERFSPVDFSTENQNGNVISSNAELEKNGSERSSATTRQTKLSIIIRQPPSKATTSSKSRSKSSVTPKSRKSTSSRIKQTKTNTKKQLNSTSSVTSNPPSKKRTKQIAGFDKEGGQDVKKPKRSAKPRAERKRVALAVVEPPQFSPVITDLSEEEIQLRLFVREFVLRFERHCRLSMKHLNIINDVTGPWGDMTFKTVIVSVLRIIYSDNFPVVDGELLKSTIKEVEKMASTNEKLWHYVTEVIESSKPPSQSTEINGTAQSDTTVHQNLRQSSVDSSGDVTRTSDSDEEDDPGNSSLTSSSPPANEVLLSSYGSIISHIEKLRRIGDLIRLALTGSYIRETIEIEHEAMRRKTIQKVAEMKTLAEAHAADLLSVKEALNSVPTKHKAEWQVRYAAVQARCDKEMHAVKEDLFRRKRKAALRNLSLGNDVYGNEYWLFSERIKTSSGWGSWIMCCKAKQLPSPTGTIIFPKSSLKEGKEPDDRQDCVNGSPNGIGYDRKDDDGGDGDESSSDLSDDDLLGDNNNWYAIETQDDAEQLSKWILYGADCIFKPADKTKPKRKSSEKPASGERKSENGTTEGDEIEPGKDSRQVIYYDDFLNNVYSSQKTVRQTEKKVVPLNLAASRESVEVLAREIKGIAEFLPSKDSSKEGRRAK
ncbi:uncharacterized protein V1516DRAFT_686094 [Lipomyces oligophaga]|uniref:uncharacterized protein n=1 Tax=Lipomyces oligophaga TaxID=45792 RepID=UPI0034CD30CE